MRRHLALLPCLLLVVCVLAVSLSGSATASSGWVFGSNVDPTVATAFDSGASGASFHLLVFGSALGQADDAAGLAVRDSLNTLDAQSVEATGAQAAVLAAQPGVQYVTTDTPMAPDGAGATAVSNVVSSASLATVYPQVDGATGLWSNGVTGAGVGIAVIDSGVTPRADFGTRLVQVQLPTEDGTQLDDAVGHGSAVAGVAAGQSPDGQYVGVAPGATVYAVNVARGDGVYTSDVLAGLAWVLANASRDNIHVVNLSLSQTEPSSYQTDVLDEAVETLWRAGITVVTSAGNFGPNSEEYAPANDPYVITVGASDTNDTATTSDDTLASFSSYGTTQDGFAKPDIVAPGRHIVTTIPATSEIAQSAPAGYLLDDGGASYVRISGTSFSAPQVSGAVALLLQESPTLSPDQIKWLLIESERPLAGSTAGALNLAGITTSELVNPGSADQNIPGSSFGSAGEQTSSFLVALATTASTGPALTDQLTATAQETTASITCALAAQVAYLRTSCASRDDSAASAWGAAAEIWSAAGFDAIAAQDESKAAGDDGQGASEWTLANRAASAASDGAARTVALAQAASWNALATQSAAWDSAAWDSASWDSAAWDSAAWDSASWDSASWDSAAWDSAAWDSASWDSAAWDAAAWN